MKGLLLKDFYMTAKYCRSSAVSGCCTADMLSPRQNGRQSIRLFFGRYLPVNHIRRQKPFLPIGPQRMRLIPMPLLKMLCGRENGFVYPNVCRDIGWNRGRSLPKQI